MNAHIRLSLPAAFAVMLISAASAIAQPLVWNSPCPTLRVKTLLNSSITVTTVTAPPGAVPPLTAPPFDESPTVPVAVGTIINGIISAGGNFYPIVQPSLPSPPAPVAADGWIPDVMLPGPPAVCVDLFFDLSNCTIYIADICRP
jgi:hypothetical protein